GVRGLAFLGFPLHPPNKPGITRAEHLDAVRVPMLFLQGTRDDLADLELIGEVGSRLGVGSTVHVVEGADHSFAVLKRSGRTNAEAMVELTDTISGWARPLA
ncbi:MAG: alpha/beta family hydrolase, partial [Gemmatimonadota bacterium]